MLLQVAMKDARADQKQGSVHSVQKGFSVVQGQALLAQAIAQPFDELLAMRLLWSCLAVCCRDVGSLSVCGYFHHDLTRECCRELLCLPDQ